MKYNKNIQLSKNLADEDLVNGFFNENNDASQSKLGTQILTKLDTILTDKLELIEQINRLETAAIQTRYLNQFKNNPLVKWVTLKKGNKVFLYVDVPFVKLQKNYKNLRIYITSVDKLTYNEKKNPIGVNMETVIKKVIDSMSVEIAYTLQNSLDV